MSNMLVVKSSLNGDNSNSNKLVKEFLAQWEKKHRGTKVVVRDLAVNELPHLTGKEMAAWMAPAEKRTEEQKKLAALSDKLIAEFKAADVIVIGMPMYNFGVPSTFKAWVDRLCRAGVTFKYTATGPSPLVERKKVYVLCSRGGAYAGTPSDSQTPWLKTTLGLIGQTELTFVYAEGMNMGAAEKSLADAKAQVAKLLA